MHVNLFTFLYNSEQSELISVLGRFDLPSLHTFYNCACQRSFSKELFFSLRKLQLILQVFIKGVEKVLFFEFRIDLTIFLFFIFLCRLAVEYNISFFDHRNLIDHGSWTISCSFVTQSKQCETD